MEETGVSVAGSYKATNSQWETRDRESNWFNSSTHGTRAHAEHEEGGREMNGMGWGWDGQKDKNLCEGRMVGI